MMIERVYNEVDANLCDELLTKLILDEKQYDDSIDSNAKISIDSNAKISNYFNNVIKDHSNILLSYKKGKKIVGYIYLKPINSDNKKGYLIDGLYVEKKFRLKGIAKKLINAGLKEVAGLCDYIDINVLYENKLALNLYKSLGFTEFKVTMRK